MINIVIADDHKMVREGLKQLLELEPSFAVVGEASDGYECLDIVSKVKPDIVLLDINMPNLDGLQTLKIMRRQGMTNKVILLTINSDADYVIRAMDYKCNGYVLKDSDFDTLKNAITLVNDGEIYIEPSLTTDISSNLVKREIVKERLENLTVRETEVLKMLSKGLLNKEIAAALNISERTVKNHVSNIFKKINVSDRTQAAVFAIKHNIVDIK